MTVRGQAKKGTTHFIRIATAYVIWRQVRLTLAVRYVLPGEIALENLQFLLDRLKTLGFSSKVLYTDKGFASTPILKYLTARGQPAIIACPIRCKKGGIGPLFQGIASYTTQHTFTDGTPATLALKASLVPRSDQKTTAQMGGFYHHLPEWDVETIYQEYRRRFGIECSYRILRRARHHLAQPGPAFLPAGCWPDFGQCLGFLALGVRTPYEARSL